MGDDQKPDLRSQLGLRKFRDRLPGVAWRRWSGGLDWLKERFGLTFLPRWLFVILAGTWALVAATLFVGFCAVLWQTIFQEPPAGQEAVWTWRFSIAQLVAVTTVMGAVIALPITINRLALIRRQTQTTEQGHITDRINTAVQGLGAEKTIKLPGEDEKTVANLEVRIGAIFALERIAQDSDRDHVQIMEILCAYIRQNAALDSPFNEKSVKLDRREACIRSDIETALKVIGRRSAEQVEITSDFLKRGIYRKRLDLKQVNLAGADLQDLKFSDIDFSGSSFRFAEMRNTKFQNVMFTGSDFSRAETSTSIVNDETIFSRCLFAGLESLHITKNATGTETFLCALRQTKFDTCMQKKDIFKNKNRGLFGWFGDQSIKINEDLLDETPPKWPEMILDEQEFIAEWREWQADPENYTPPKPDQTA